MMMSEASRLRRFLFDVGLPAALFSAVALIVYGASLHNAFVSWDDTALIYGNTILKDVNIENIRRAFTSYDPELYIPLTLLSWQVDYAMGGLHPLPYHLGNLVLHVLCALLAMAFVRKLTAKAWLGWLVGLLFITHPLNVEAVAWASARKDTLSTFFCLASLLTYVHYTPTEDRIRGRRWIYTLSVALFALGLLAKVSIVMLPLVLVLIDWVRRRPMTKGMILDKLPYTALSCALGVVALFGKREVLESTGTGDKILMAAKSTMFYVQKLLVPTDLTVLYPYTKAIAISSQDFIVPMILTLALMAFTVWLAFRSRMAAFGLTFFLINLLPSFTNFAKGGEVYFASDRYAYLPSIGIFLVFGLLVENIVRRSSDARTLDRNTGIAGIGILGILGAFGVLASLQTTIWRNSETLFRDVLKKQPDAIAAHLNLAIIDREAGRLDAALAQARAAFAIHPRMEVYTNFANIYKLQGRTDLAKAEYQKAIAAYPQKPEPQMGLGIIEQEAGHTEQAIAAYERAIQLEPEFPAAYVNLGSAYEHTNRLPEAEAALTKAMEINPRFAEGWQALGIVHERQENFAAAAADYRKALELNPALTEVTLQLCAVELRQGHNAVALELLKGLLKKNPNNADAKALLNEMIKMGIVGTK